LFPDIRQRFEPYMEWLEKEEVLAVQYEDFIDDASAVDTSAVEPSANACRKAIARVLDHALQRGFPLSISQDAAIQALEASIDPQRSPTFRSGKRGGWQSNFSQENKDLFKKVAGDLLIRLGYETDNDW
jgi:hypothetical protein